MSVYEEAVRAYADYGVDANAAIDAALSVPVSIHCWQADDVKGFEIHEGAVDSGGILATGAYPGAARNIEEVRQDLAKIVGLVPGTSRVNLHAIYADTKGKQVDRAELTFEHFESWVEWAEAQGLKLDFNPTYFAHPHASDGLTLAHPNPDIRNYWIRHGIACRRIGGAIGTKQGSDAVNNHWIPDGFKDSPADRWAPRKRLKSALDEVLSEEIPGNVDAVESKLFGLASEDYVVGSFEFYSQYALQAKKLLCIDMGHFHPTESVADKISALLQFQDRILLHVSRPVRWDSDHVVIFNDDVKNLFLELKRGDAFGRAVVALDYFDASINRPAAYVIGIRATRKAILNAMLDPTALLTEAEKAGRLAEKLALMEEAKTLPFGAVWDELCSRAKVPVGREWIAQVSDYEKDVLSKR